MFIFYIQVYSYTVYIWDSYLYVSAFSWIHVPFFSVHLKLLRQTEYHTPMYQPWKVVQEGTGVGEGWTKVLLKENKIFKKTFSVLALHYTNWMFLRPRNDIVPCMIQYLEHQVNTLYCKYLILSVYWNKDWRNNCSVIFSIGVYLHQITLVMEWVLYLWDCVHSNRLCGKLCLRHVCTYMHPCTCSPTSPLMQCEEVLNLIL